MNKNAKNYTRFIIGDLKVNRITKQELIELINRYPEEIIMEVLGYGYNDFFSYTFSPLRSITAENLEWKIKREKSFQEEENF